MTTLAEQISDDTGLPLVDVMDMGLWDYPGSETDDTEGPRDADDLGCLEASEPVHGPEWTPAEILNDDNPFESHPRASWEERHDPEDAS